MTLVRLEPAAFSLESSTLPLSHYICTTNIICNTHYYDRNLIWLSVAHGVDEVIPLDHPRCRKQTVQKLYHLSVYNK